MAKRRVLTAEDLMHSLRTAPEWVAREEAREAEMLARAAELAADEASLLAALRDADVSASSVYDFVNAGGAPHSAVPALVEHLNRPHDARIHEGIIRALTVRHARELALIPLMKAFEVERDAILRWVIANALSVLSSLDEIRELKGIEAYAELFSGRLKGERRPA